MGRRERGSDAGFKPGIRPLHSIFTALDQSISAHRLPPVIPLLEETSPFNHYFLVSGSTTNTVLSRGTRFILRKKPAGTIISPVAHQVDREFRVLEALGSVEGFPVPKVYTLCMDSSVIGTPFYVC